MRIIALSRYFYQTYADCDEILKKNNRPYAFLEVKIGDVSYAVPLRHHIHHKFAFHTVGEAGIDYTKSIPIISDKFISADEIRIDSYEWSILRGNEEKIAYEFAKYVNQYRRALLHPEFPRNQNILQYSTLQYFPEIFKENL